MHRCTSVHGVPIRLTPERWIHVIEAHDDLAGALPDVLDTLESPDWVTKGYGGALIAWKGVGRKRFLGVVYKERSRNDGFVITAYFTSKPKRRHRIWP
jgi:hypothetical protein